MSLREKQGWQGEYTVPARNSGSRRREERRACYPEGVAVYFPVPHETSAEH
jgi:hypothetical protein